jgi:CHASE3 domain sensor protein
MVKGGITAGKQIYSMTKELTAFFDAVDGANQKHQKKKTSIFASANEEALNTFLDKQKAADAEEQLRELITNTRGISAYKQLQALRREIRMERKEDQRLALIKAEEMRENVLSALLIIGFLLLCIASGGGYLWHLGFIKF